MKTLKMKGLLVAMLLMVLQWTTTAQGIRKEWHEMTANEKLSLMEAMKYAQDEFGTYYKMGYFHGQRFSEIHFNPPAQDQFGAWHRWAIFTLERDLQKFQPELSMPFWDWTTYNTKGDEMWDAQHLGQFDNTSNWFAPLNRHVTSSFPLPTTADVNSVLSISDWDTFNNTLETGSVHVGGHVWTGGTMASGTSPWDPVFFFHHNTVDKVWQEWVDAGGVPSYNVSLLSNSLNGNSNYLWPENIDPDDLHDSKTIGVFLCRKWSCDIRRICGN